MRRTITNATWLLLLVGIIFGVNTLLGSSLYAAGTPTIIGISPTSGSIAGGDSITITGTNFDESATVRFGANTSASVQWINDTTIVALSPAGYSGVTDISVTNLDGQTATSVNGFLYAEASPSISNISPNAGPANGGQGVTINGSNFTNGTMAATSISTDTLGSGGSTCGIYNANKVYCWGYNGFGQLGTGTTTSTLTPVAFNNAGELTDKTVRSLASGAGHRCAVASDNKAYCWGRYPGNGGSAYRYNPTAIDTSGVLAGKSITQVVVGDQTSCALSTDGQVFCWGVGTSGQLGNNAAITSSTPVAVDTTGALLGKTVRQISAGANHACALTTENLAYCWGMNSEGRLGNNAVASTVTTPVAVTMSGVLSGKTINSIHAGGAFTCAIASDNQAYCWGANSSGQLGNSGITPSRVPTAVTATGVLSGKTVTSMATGFDHTCAIASDGHSYCWGANASGQLGNNSSVRAIVPVAVDITGVLAGKTIRSLNLGLERSCSIASDSQVYCWGNSSSGSLGNGSSSNRSSPVASNQVKATTPTVTFGGTNATNITLVSSAQLNVTTPAHTLGAANVVVRNYDTQSATATNSYQFVAGPTLSTITPNSGLLTNNTAVTIKGTNFYVGMTVTVGGIPLTNISVVDSETISGTIPSSTTPGAQNIVISDPYGQTATITNGYAYRLPDQTINSITPDSGKHTGNYTVTIKGTGFIDRGGSLVWYRVLFGTTLATQVTYVDSTTLTALVPSRPLGRTNVTVASDYSSDAILTNGFTFLANSYRFNNTALSISATQPGKLTVQALNNIGNGVTSPVATVVQLSSTSASGSFAVNLSEDETTRWSHTSVTIPANASSVDVWYKDDASGNPTVTGLVEGVPAFQQQQTITSKYKFAVSGVSDPVTSGVPSSVTVRVVDYNGNPLTGYTGTFAFSSTDSAAQLPTSYTMSSADNGIKTFINGITMKTPGEFCVTTIDTIDSTTTGSQCNISVRTANSGAVDHLSVITQPQFIPADTSSTPITVQAQDVSGVPISASVDTPLYIYSTSATAAFSADGITWSGDKPFVLTLVAGSTSANIYIKDTATRTSTISIRDLSTDTANNGETGDLAWKNTSQQLTTGVASAHHVALAGTDSLLLGQKSTYTLTLKDSNGNTVTALSDSQFTLSSSTATTLFYLDSNSTGVSGPVTISLSRGSSSLTFQMSDTTVSNGLVMTHVAATDTRAANDLAYLNEGSADIQILSAATASVKVTPQQNNVEAGAITQVSLQLLDTNGDPTYASATKGFALVTSSGTGKYSLTSSPFTPITSVNLLRGEGTKQLYYRDTLVGTSSIRATSNGLASTPSVISVTSSSTFRFGITPSSSSTPLGAASAPYTVTTYDVYGNIVIQPSNLTAYLYSSDPAVLFATQPNGPWTATSLTIPAGQSSGQFYASSATFLGQAATLTVSDAAPLDSADTGIVNTTAQFAVVSQPATSASFSSTQPSIIAGQASGVVTVQLKKADGSAAIQDGTTTVNVSVPEGKFTLTANPSASSVSSIPVAKGSSSVSFYYSGQKSGAYTMRAQLGSVTTTQQAIVSADQPAELMFVSPPQTLTTAQASSQIKVAIIDHYGNPASFSSNTTISLSSSCADGTFSESGTSWQSTNSINVLSGSTDFIFYYTGTVSGTCNLTTSTSGVTSDSQAVTLTKSGPTKLTIHGPVSLEKGQTGSFTIDATNSAGDITPADSAFSVAVLSDSATGSAAPTIINFTEGQTTRSFTYTDSAAKIVNLTARDNNNTLVDGSASVTITEGLPAKLHITPTTSTQYAGEKSQLTVALRNQYDQPVTANGAVQVTLTSSEITGKFYESADSTQLATTLTIANGQQSAQVLYAQAKSTQATVSASAAGMMQSNAYVTVLSSSIASIEFTSSAHTGAAALEAGQQGSYRVGLLDQYGNQTTAPSAITLYASSTANGTLSNAGTFTIPANTPTAVFTYTQTQPGSFTMTVSDAADGGTATLGPITQAGEVVPGVPAMIQFTQAGLTLERGGVSNKISVRLTNENGYVVSAPAGGKVVSFSMVDGSGLFSSTPNGAFTNTLQITIPAGETEVGAYYRNDDAQIEDRSCTTSTNGTRTCSTSRTYQHLISAQTSLQGTSKATSMLATMQYGEPVRLAIVSPQRQQQTDRPTALITVERQNQYGKPVPLHKNSFINVSTSNTDSGAVGSSKVQWGVSELAILDSNASTSFYYKDSQAGAPTLSISSVADNLIGDSQQVTITQGSGPSPPVASFIVTNISDPQNQGVPSSVIVIAVDTDGFIVDSYAGTIHFTSDDPTATLPADYTFNPATDKGAATLTNEVAFSSSGEKAVTATDSQGITGSQTGITVLGGNTNNVRSVAFVTSHSPLQLQTNQASPLITIQLRDVNGDPAVAPSGGFKIRLTSQHATGQFSDTSQANWSLPYTVTIPQGLTFATLYYKDSLQGEHDLTAADWLNNVDQPTISNGTLKVNIDDDQPTQPVDPIAPLEPTSPTEPTVSASPDKEAGAVTPGQSSTPQSPAPSAPNTTQPNGSNSPEPATSAKPSDVAISSYVVTGSAIAMIAILVLLGEAVRHVVAMYHFRKIVDVHHIAREQVAKSSILQKATRSPFASAFFWVPVIVSTILVYGAVQVFSLSAEGKAPSMPLVVASISTIVLFVIGFNLVHSFYLSQESSGIRNFFKTINVYATKDRTRL